jgi:hypothetical protein
LKYEAIKNGKRGKKCFVGQNGGKWSGVARVGNEAGLKLRKKNIFSNSQKPVFDGAALGKKKLKPLS